MLKQLKTLWNGQVVDLNETVGCPVCRKRINVRVGWVDPYNSDKYVHFGCLSENRKEEIKNAKV